MINHQPRGPAPRVAATEVCWLEDLPSTLRGSIAVVVDVLAATTNINDMLGYGANLFLTNRNQLLDDRDKLDRPILIGESRANPFPDGDPFHCSNSPRELKRLLPEMRGRNVLYMTNNGTRVIEDCLARGADKVLAGAFVNIGALVNFLTQATHASTPIVVIPAGERGLGNPPPRDGEDLFAAEAIARKLRGQPSEIACAIADSFAYTEHGYDPILMRESVRHEDFAADCQLCFVANRSAVVGSVTRNESGLLRVSPIR